MANRQRLEGLLGIVRMQRLDIGPEVTEHGDEAVPKHRMVVSEEDLHGRPA